MWYEIISRFIGEEFPWLIHGGIIPGVTSILNCYIYTWAAHGVIVITTSPHHAELVFTCFSDRDCTKINAIDWDWDQTRQSIRLVERMEQPSDRVPCIKLCWFGYRIFKSTVTFFEFFIHDRCRHVMFIDVILTRINQNEKQKYFSFW